MQPKKVKHRKWHKGRRRFKGNSKGGTELNFGAFGLKADGTKWITARQIESARKTIAHRLQKGGKLWIRIFPDKPVTQKGQEVPMGGGKGSVEHYVVAVKPGRILFEIDGVSEEIAKEAIKLASHKLPIRTKFVKK
ncbi:MAG TPA: 50S ribosomal protein L16 [Candidatus Paceibacterota bacterium]|nr:50S ribosomal protein L16 [Candidatus Paceibacterota bacterium]